MRVLNRSYPSWLQVWFDGEHSDAWGPSRLFENVLAYILNDMRSDEVAIDEDPLHSLRNPPDCPGRLRKLLHCRQRYKNPLPVGGNQVRHASCKSIKPGGVPDPTVFEPNENERRMVTILKQCDYLSELTHLYYYSSI